MARSRRDLAILARIGAKFRNFTPTYPHHDLFALGKVADFAPGILEIAVYFQAAVKVLPVKVLLGAGGQARGGRGSRGGQRASVLVQLIQGMGAGGLALR